MKKIFLMCSERSGSNLITKIFDAHPGVSGPSTSHIADVILPNLYKYDNLRGNNWRRLISDICFLLDTKNAVWKRNFTVSELKKVIPEGNVALLFSYIYQEEAKANNKDIVFIKENRIYEISQFFVEHYPNASYLYMVRDPRDMAASWKHSFSIRGGVIRAANIWLKDQTGFLRMRSWLSGQLRIPFFLYEDLLTNPKIILKKICKLLNIDYSEEMLYFYLKKETMANARAAADWGNIARPLISDNFGKYEEKLSESEIMYIESLCYQYMLAFGYKPKYKCLSIDELNILEKDLSGSELEEKVIYKTISSDEKYRRKKHYTHSSYIQNGKFCITSLLNKNSVDI